MANLKIWDGTQWVPAGIGPATANIQPGPPATPMTGQLWFDSDDPGPNGVVWSPYTPTWGNALSLGNGTSTGRYVQMGNTVHFSTKAVLGSTSTIVTGSGSISVSLPPGLAVRAFSAVTVQFLDYGNNYFAGMPAVMETIVGATTLPVYGVGTNGITLAIAPTAPFTWSANDAVVVNATYEVM